MPTFYGIEMNIFKRLRQVCQGNWSLLSELPELPDSDFRLSNLSWLRDGSITGPLEFFEYIETQPF